MPNWKNQESRDKLLAALVASLDGKSLNYTRIAALFGEDTTYHAIEGQFRAVRKQAQQLKDACDSNGSGGSQSSGGGSPTGAGAGSGSGTRRKATASATPGTAKRAKTKHFSPSQRRDVVLAGRVTKSKSITPTNNHKYLDAANTVRGFKEEIESSDASSMAATPNMPTIDPFQFPVGSTGYDGACDDLLSSELFADSDLIMVGDSFGSDGSYASGYDLFEA